ncbi:MAG: B12-binding domain-containing radical SAM protein [Dehalococcoidia bacterium]|nr:B12-binding domain-containing radical SAM protein [Dehalococcoidia bacterium]
MKILLVYPQNPETFWSFKHALKFVSRKVAFPPLGLLTVAAMLPSEWEKKLVDMNAATLTDKDINWADYVFISAMAVQQDSAREVINRCKKFETKIVAGGPLFSTGYEEFGFDDIDHLILSEAEDILPLFLEDLEKGCAKHIYVSEERPDITKTPAPLWPLVDKKKYHSMSIQYSRGCPFNCEFCDIVVMNGHIPRTKDKEQIITELEALYNRGWRGSVFFVDDNFIGNKRKLKSEILPAMTEWMEEKKHPFSFFTEASINLADDEGLMRSMNEAGFDTVFVGIESPNEESLVECNKLPNKNRDLLASVKKIQNHGFQVQGGFIVGFDSDPLSIFRSQISFIQNSGIVTAMVGVLMAPPGTGLYKRLKNENRLLPGGSGDNTDGSTNFVPKMGYERLANGYKHVLDTIYSPKPYYERIKTFLREYKPKGGIRMVNVSPRYILALIRSMWVIGIREKGRMYYWKFFAWTLLKKPKSFPLSITLAVQGFHFRKVAEKIQAPPIKHLQELEQVGT